MDERSRHRLFEDHFLNQLRARALALTHGKLPADDVSVEATPEGMDAVRAQLGRLEVYDRDAIDSMPGTSSMQFRFTRKILGGLFRKTVARLRARVLTPVEELIRGTEAGPVGREQVLDALARYQVLPRRERPSGVVLASATGFTPEAKSLIASSADPSVILLGGREDGGWDLTQPRSVETSKWAKLFELESRDDRIKRLLYHLDQDAKLLDSRGITVAELSEKLGLPRLQTEQLVRQACRTDSRLITVVHDGKISICRSPLAEESSAMNVMQLWSRIRKLLGMKPTSAERVRELTSQRVQVEQQRYELDRRVNALESDERELLKRGGAAASAAEKRQLAAKLVRARRELTRVRSQQQIFTQQIDIIGTQIHNLTLAEQGKRVALPKAEDLTATAADAEQVVSELSANADLAREVEVTGETPMMAEEEASILAEFEQLAGAAAQAKPAETAQTKESTPAEPSAAVEPGSSRREAAPADDNEESAKPELG